MQITLNIEGMTCGGCVRSVENALARVDGFASATVDLAGGKAVVETSEDADPARFVAAVEDAGYDATLAR